LGRTAGVGGTRDDLARRQLVVASLSALRGAEIDAATQALALLCAHQGQEQAAEVLERWARERVDSA
jgi:hypothetical protein